MDDKRDSVEEPTSELDSRNEADQPERRGLFFTRQLPLESETSFFILANALDFFMTYLLLSTGKFRESNEVANRFLQIFEVQGLIVFKFSVVAFVCVLAQVIALKQPETAKKLLVWGTVVVFLVVAYSAFLFAKYTGLMG